MTATTPVTPRPAATVMLLRNAPTGRDGLEVLLLRRSTDTPFVPGAHVFPGGAVEDRDADAAWDAVTDFDDATASAALDVDAGGRAYWVAAVRECLEEAGVFIATVDDVHIDDTHPVLTDEDGLRADLERGDTSLLDLCLEHRLRLPLEHMTYFAQWITPAESPRRYDTRFFAVPMPDGQSASADGWEAVDATWWAPTDALESWQADAIQLIEPTVESIRLLVGHDSVDHAMAALRRAGEHAR
ncbi:NUDIX hydrolase [Actinospongicola halichondriae]|uniref:NUDIX hydrolase n=1 Tax=Actinospongicola halichondriae TaxID=3236844 RepID=UPI003D562BEE